MPSIEPLRRMNGTQGLSLIELIVCTVIIGVLSATALPLSRHFVESQKEEALKERLHELRDGLDRYRDKVRARHPERAEEECFPTRLEDLVEERVLRRIPIDPMTGRPDWLTRSTGDVPNASSTDGLNIFDVRSAATGASLDGRPFSEW